MPTKNPDDMLFHFERSCQIAFDPQMITGQVLSPNVVGLSQWHQYWVQPSQYDVRHRSVRARWSDGERNKAGFTFPSKKVCGLKIGD